MMATQSRSLPFLTTHVANIALNKQLGLVFLTSEAQRTCGLTEVSHESLMCDQIQVGTWMIDAFLPPLKSEAGLESWLELEPYNARDPFDMDTMLPDQVALGKGKEVIESIRIEMERLGNAIWDIDRIESLAFLRKLIIQGEECISYTVQRTILIKKLVDLHSANDQTLMGATSALGYLAVKNAVTAPMIFSREFLKILRCVVTKKAVAEGYVALASSK